MEKSHLVFLHQSIGQMATSELAADNLEVPHATSSWKRNNCNETSDPSDPWAFIQKIILPMGIHQGFPNQNCQKYMAVALKQCILDPKLVKPKRVWEAVDLFYFWKFVYNFSKKTTTSQTHFGYFKPRV